MIALVLLICALVCFILAAIGIPSNVNLTALGLTFLAASMLVGRI